MLAELLLTVQFKIGKSKLFVSQSPIAGSVWNQVLALENPHDLSHLPASCSTLPVTKVTLVEAYLFARTLAAQTGIPWRLPTEAERLVYANPNGAAIAGNFGTGELTPVGTYPLLNGLDDLYGNCWEWVLPDDGSKVGDLQFQPTARAYGGSFGEPFDGFKWDAPLTISPLAQSPSVGFRLVHGS